ncbi:MAG: alanine--tRNA ligase [Candidatus Moraniibacteriota bacterium]
MTTNELRSAYIAFFEERGHQRTPSAPLVPENDPTTLFTGSGMQPMLPYFLGEVHPLGQRIVDSQKCFRTGDIEEVGDNRHTTFFEMLGNWSFGDYFKVEQIDWMWEFLTKEIGIDPERLYFTCFRGNDALGVPRDTESAKRWQKRFAEKNIEAGIIDFPERDGMQGGRIFYYDEKKNWWSRVGAPAGMPTGEPGGPDTEMFFDFHPELGDQCIPDTPFSGDFCHVNCDCGRFMEIGNNVFMQYKKTDSGFEELPSPNVDFGGGLERLLAATNNTPDVLRLDMFDTAREALERMSRITYGSDEKSTFAMRVILDHLRAASFLIGDGVYPSNKDQGYFVRRLIRRAVRFGLNLTITSDFTKSLGEANIATYADTYPSLLEKKELILSELSKEEAKFRKTLENGLRQLEKFLANTENHLYGRAVFPNEEVAKMIFDLYQTYGFPTELTFEELHQRGISYDENKLKLLLEKHRDLSRTASAGKFKGGLADHSEKVTAFHTATHLMLAGLRKELGEGVHQAGSNITEERTRFDFTYPEKVSREILDRVESYVNEAIAKEAVINTEIMDKGAAKATGVEGSFWEKYPEKVTVYRVEAPDGTIYSQELCGGPHVTTTKDIATFGTFKIIKEEASSAGVRRIKAILQ